MEFKWISMNKIGMIATLFLILLINQLRVFDYLLNTSYGRIILILFIVLLSCSSRILGTIFVFFIIIIFFQNNKKLVENFSSNESNKNILNNINNSSNVNKNNIDSNILSTTLKNTKEKFIGREGHNISDKEFTMLTGKNSNQISVPNSYRNQSDSIQPSDNNNKIFSKMSYHF